MFFKFDNLSGRIARTNVQAAYTPQGFTAKVAEAPEIKFSSAQTKFASVPDPQRVVQSSTGGEVTRPRGFVPNSSSYRNVMSLQEKWAASAQDGLLVWQKLGRDRGMYYVTLGLSVVGTALCCQVLWKMSWPKPVPAE